MHANNRNDSKKPSDRVDGILNFVVGGNLFPSPGLSRHRSARIPGGNRCHGLCSVPVSPQFPVDLYSKRCESFRLMKTARMNFLIYFWFVCSNSRLGVSTEQLHSGQLTYFLPDDKWLTLFRNNSFWQTTHTLWLRITSTLVKIITDPISLFVRNRKPSE